MRDRYQQELDGLGQDVLDLADVVVSQVQGAARALKMGDAPLAQDIIDKDRLVDLREIKISSDCASLIAREQPVASDLRHIIAYLKAVSDIERIGDYAVHAAKRAKDQPMAQLFIANSHIPRMMDLGAEMLHDAARALIARDEASARQIAQRDAELDQLKKLVYLEILDMMAKDSTVIENATKFLFLSRFLERMGDHAVTICSWAIFSAKGEYIDLR